MVVVGVTGHRGLSPYVEKYAQEQVRRILAGIPPAELTGVSCLAAGADTVFADLVLELGGTLRVVLPARRYRAALPASHHDRYDHLVSVAETVTRIDREIADPEAYMQASTMLVDAVDRLVAIWDGQPSRGLGGTAEVVAYAQLRSVPVTVIWPTGVGRP